MPLFLLIRKEGKHAEAEPLEWAAFVLALLVLSPVPASYHFVVLIFSMILLVEHLLSDGGSESLFLRSCSTARSPPSNGFPPPIVQ